MEGAGPDSTKPHPDVSREGVWLRRILRLVDRWRRRPRFKPPGAGLALILFVLAALLSIWGGGSEPPAAVPVPAPPPAQEPTPPPAAAPAPVPVEPAVEPVPPEPQPAGCPQGCEEQLPGCDIKGNTSYRTGERIYHVRGQQNYDDTVIEPWKGERWFCTEEEAVANGWRKAKR
jgi:hypothetical protein